MQIEFVLLIYDGSRYYKGYPGIFIADYADLLGWDAVRDNSFWTRVEEHYYNNLELQLTIDVNEETTFREIERHIVEKIGFDPLRFLQFGKWSYFLADGEFVRVEDLDIPLSKIFKYYHICNSLRYFFIFSNQAGDIWRDEGLRYYMNSRERGKHNEPHVHVDYKHESSASICIHDGRVLDGSLPSRKLKIVQKRILENKQFLFTCWNKMTDGLKVDINQYWDIIPLECE